MPINYYVGDVGSYMGTTASGITFSSTGITVNGVSGSSVALSSTTKSGNNSFLGDSTPLVFINTTTSPNQTNYTLPDGPSIGTVVMVRRTDTAASGTTNLFAGQISSQTIRTIGSNTNVTSITISIVMSNGEEVMMSWEHPLMKRHADICSSNGGVILEVGFGMGISADYIQSNNVSKHIIVESHPQILELLHKWSNDKPNVVVISGDWFDKIDDICKYSFDGIFFDTHCDTNRFLFKKLVADVCVKPGGIFTWFEPRGVDFFRYGNIQSEVVEVNPIDCSYYDLPYAICPYYINSK